MIIYKARNIITNSFYIGKTIRTLHERKLSHFRTAYSEGKNNYFSRAIRKYGKENFEWTVICECFSNDEMNEKEIFYISYFKKAGYNLYNITTGGEGTPGRKSGMFGKKHKPETIEKMKKAQKGRVHSEQARRLISETLMGHYGAMNGKHHSKETIEKMKKSQSGKKLSEETKEKIRLANTGEKNPNYKKETWIKGKHHSEESKRKMLETKRLNKLKREAELEGLF